jgi:predicted dehydrogenase
MARACRRAGVLYGTAFDQRHHPAHRALRDQVRAGRIGTVTAVRVVYACWVGPDWSACAGRENWRIDPAKAGGGALMDLAPHGIDLVEFLLGEPIVDIAALTQTRVQDYEVDDGALVIGRTAGGVLVQLHIAYNCPERLPRRRLEIIGDRGQFTALDTMGQDPGGTVIFTDERGAMSPVDVPDAGSSPFRNQVLAFGEALHDPAQTTFSIERDLHTMRLLARAYASAERAAPAPKRLARAGLA